MAFTPFVSDIEMNQNTIYRACFHAENSAPKNPKDGQYYLNKSDNRVYFYRTSDNKWHKIGDGIIYTAGNGIEISPTYVISVKENITDQIELNRLSIIEINDDIDDISDTIVTMQQDITINRTNISNNKQDINQIDTEITVINTNILSLQDDITALINRISADERNITTNANDIISLENRMNNVESEVATNKADVTAVEKRVSKNETDISKLQTDLSTTNTNVTNLQNNKLDKNFTSELLTDIDLIRKSVTDVVIKETKINPSTRVTSTNENTLPLVDSVNSGLATAEMVNTIARNKSRIEALEQQGGHYIGQSFATVADLSSFTITDDINVGDFTYVIDDENHEEATTRYIVSINGYGNKEFKFAYVINYDPVKAFTQDGLGLIIGKNEDGYVYAESDGSGSVVGWSALKQRVSNNETNLSDLTDAFNNLVTDDINDLKTRMSIAETDIDSAELSIDDLKTNKANKSQLQSVVTDLSLRITANDDGENDNVDLIKTTYNAVSETSTNTNIRLNLAAISKAGLMSAEDKRKLDGIQDNAEVNQNAYSCVFVDGDDKSLVAESKSDAIIFKAGNGISLEIDPENKQLIIESTIVPVTTTANWQDNGLQSAFDKKREDKMGQELWEANIDSDGNYTIDLEDYQGYVGEDSHLFIKFMQANTTKTPKLTIKSTTASYVLIDAAPIKKTGLLTPDKKFIAEQSIWEVIYMSGTFYMVATSGSGGGVGSSGYNGLTTTGNVKAISGTVEANTNQTFMINMSAFTKTSSGLEFCNSGTLFVNIQSGSTEINKDNSGLSWVSQSGHFKNNDNGHSLDNINNNYLNTNNIGININGLEWTLFIKRSNSNALYEYKAIDLMVSNGEEPEIETYSNEMCSSFASTEAQLYSIDNNIYSVSGKHEINNIIQITREEFEKLKDDKQIVEGMIYNVTDDQVETLEIYTVSDYNTLSPSSFGMQAGGTINITAEPNANFAVNDKASSGIVLCGDNSYTIICQEEGSENANLYYRMWYNGSWGDWKLFSSGDLDSFVKSTDKSVKNILTVTQEEYDNLLLNSTVDSNTMYNVVNESGNGIVSRFNEYTSVTQLGLSETTNMSVASIVAEMSNNSVLHTELSSTFTISGNSATSGILEIIKVDSDTYYAKVYGNGLDSDQIARTVLYSNSTGTTRKVTLSQSSANFSYLRIYYKVSDSFGEEYTEVYSPNGKKAYISTVYEQSSDSIKFISETLSISGTSITRESGTSYYITRVEGEK